MTTGYWLDIVYYLEGNKAANDAISSALPVSGCPIISFRVRSEGVSASANY